MIRPAFIYAIRVGDAVKIGYAVRPRMRIQGIQSSTPGKITSAVCVEVHHDDKAKIEARLHENFRYAHVRGEWFQITMADARQALKKLGPIHNPLSRKWKDPEAPVASKLSELDYQLLGAVGAMHVQFEINRLRRSTTPWTEVWWRSRGKPGYWRAITWNYP